MSLDSMKEIFDRMEAEHSRAQRHGSALSIILGDVDHFKRINDTCGHKVGDQVLVDLARLARGCTRESDWVTRWGGEEFLLILPGCDIEQAARRAEQLRQHCRQHIAPHKAPEHWFVCDAFPLTGSGKVQKFRLRELARQGDLQRL